MYSINALELPEIAKIIAGHLDNIEPCLVVCKSWRSLYLPHYWRGARAGIQAHGRKDHTPFFDPLRHGRYRKFIRKLMVYNNLDCIDHSNDYPNLRLLRLYYHGDEVQSRPVGEDSVLGDFINRHPLLECLDLHDIPPATTDSAWTALVHHPRLDKVILGRSSSYPDDFWKVCTRLRTLEIAYFNDATQKCIPETLALPSIRRLKLVAQYNVNIEVELDIIAACPLLEELVWMAGYYHEHPARAIFGELATQGTWPHLRQLSINFDIEDADLAQVIASMYQATKIEIYSESFGPLCFAALQHHANTLQHLLTPVMESRMTRDILCTFPRLEYLKAPLLNAKDIVEGGPWACTSLKYISVKISFNSDDDDLQPVVFERMSRLVHLEEFENRFYHSPGATPEHGLRFRLESGMAALANLSRLRIVRLDPNIQAMDLDDVRWIIDHWKRLETIRGNLSQDKSMAEQLEALISTNGIELQSDS